jgi:DNA-directed RNA polymerase subunit RPC12/RpoP
MSYIDKELLLQDISETVVFSVRSFDSPELRGAKKVIDRILNAPAVDAVEVKHGEWIEKEEIYGDVYYTCSNCNNDWTTIDGTPQDNFMNYCPNCGAKMDGTPKERGGEK